MYEDAGISAKNIKDRPAFQEILYGLKSMRKTCEKVKVDVEYRWFLKILFGEDTPHYSTFSKNYERRFKDSDVFERIFINIVE